MVRSCIRKTDRMLYPPGHVIQAVQEVLSRNLTMVSASKKISIPYRSLTRYCEMDDISQLRSDSSLGGYQQKWRVFILL